MRTDPEPVTHVHRFTQVHPFQPERDRCDCGTYHYEVMGPFRRHAAKQRMIEEYAEAEQLRRDT